MSLIINGLSDKELTCEEYYVAYFDALGTRLKKISDSKKEIIKLEKAAKAYNTNC